MAIDAGPDPMYIVLMTNSQTTTMTSTATLTKPVGEWFTALSADLQADITEMVNENGYPLSDIEEFVENYGADAYSKGYYVAWCELTEDGHDNDAIEAFVDEFGIQEIERFEDAYYGEYGSENEFAEQYTTDCYTLSMPEWVVVDWQATWDTELSDSFTYNNGYVFNSTY